MYNNYTQLLKWLFLIEVGIKLLKRLINACLCSCCYGQYPNVTVKMCYSIVSIYEWGMCITTVVISLTYCAILGVLLVIGVCMAHSHLLVVELFPIVNPNHSQHAWPPKLHPAISPLFNLQDFRQAVYLHFLTVLISTMLSNPSTHLHTCLPQPLTVSLALPIAPTTLLQPAPLLTSIQLKLKVVVGVCNYVIFLANIFK